MKYNELSTPTKMGTLHSSLRNPTEIIYDKETSIIPPHGRVEDVEREKITNIPSGIKFIPYPVRR